MNAKTAHALSLVEEALSKYTEIPSGGIQPETLLADLQIDSLTLAELLFELEDRLGTSISEVTQPPKQISEILALIEPYLDDPAVKSAA
jgi:acyl carrier protein